MSQSVRVVRMEKPNGIGPFQGLSRYSKLYDLMYKQLRLGDHMSCTVESNSYRGLDDYLFACETEGDLYAYFGDEAIEYMLSHGFEMRWYDVPEENIIYGRGELAFLPTKEHEKARATHYNPPVFDYNRDSQSDWGKIVF